MAVPAGITAPPTAPSRSSPSTFDSDAEAFVAWFPTFLDDWANLSASTFFAVQSDRYDTTAGKVQLTGAFGVGLVAGSYPLEYDFATYSANPTGLYWYNNTGSDPGPSNFGALLAFNYAASSQMRIAVDSGGGEMWFGRVHGVDGESAWNQVVHLNNLLGTVSQTGGVPTGAVIERGSNANGEYVRWADGTQICTNDNAAITTAPAAFTGTITKIDSDKLWLGRWF